jgi:hypothetical protein
MSARTLIRIAIVAVVLVGSTTTQASAQDGTHIRVASPNATVMSRASIRSDVMATPPPGAILDVLDRDGDWYWVLLEPDRNGTRRPGWIRATDLEGGYVERPAELSSRPLKAKWPPKAKQNVRAESGQPARDRRADRAQEAELRRAVKARLEEDRRLQRAQQDEERRQKQAQLDEQRRLKKTQAEETRLKKVREDFEKAQREYDKLVQSTPTK